MKCPSCRTRNRSDRHFCAQCGASLIQICGRCGFSNGAADLYCGGCGNQLQVGTVVGSIASRAEEPARSPALVPVAADRADMLSPEELGALLKKPEPVAPEALPIRVTQEDLDRLFGAKP
jgi:hypothetical protein